MTAIKVFIAAEAHADTAVAFPTAGQLTSYGISRYFQS
jgi:hypothetical protein